MKELVWSVAQTLHEIGKSCFWLGLAYAIAKHGLPFTNLG